MKRRSKVTLTGAVVAPGLAAGAAGTGYAVRAANARRSGVPLVQDMPTPAPTAALAGAVALDTLISIPIAVLSSIWPPHHYQRAQAEVDAALAYYEHEGWLGDPAGRHPAPTETPAAQAELLAGREPGVEVLRFPSGWAPHPLEPAAQRWNGFEANKQVTVRLLRHPGPPRPWLIAIHGQSMGRPGDLKMLRVRQLHERLGLNIALPILPLHGPRADGIAPDHLFVSNLFLLNNVFGLTQSVWDVRRLMLWLREKEQAPAVGVLGVSLGSYVTGLLSTHEPDLTCAVAVVPTCDLAESLRAAEPVVAARAAAHRELHGERSTRLLSVVSPLARPSLVPKQGRHLIAGQGDRIAAPSQAARLWKHWEEPDICWRPRGHLTTWRSSAYDDEVVRMLRSSGLVFEGEGSRAAAE